MKRLLWIIDIVRTIRHIGLLQSITFYLNKNKKGKEIEVKVRGYENTITIRGGTSDPWVLDNNILREEYKDFVSKPPKTILDCGANIGTASIYWNKLYPDAHIVAIEPDPDNYRVLCKNTENVEKINCIQGGIWSHDTMLSFENKNVWKYALKVKEDKEDGEIKAFGISSIMNEFKWDFIDILKLDVEGSEVEVLSNNISLWINKIGTLIIELHPEISHRGARILFNAFSDKDIELAWRGENLVIKCIYNK